MTQDRLATPKYADIEAARPQHVPGLVVVFAHGQPQAVPVPMAGGSIELGREHPALPARPDPHISRRHLRVAFDGRRFLVTDLRSSNGTAVDGAPLLPGSPREASRVIRIGETLLVPAADLRPLQERGVKVVAGRVEGPKQQEALAAAREAARVGRTLQIIGESGAGREGIARAFHAAGPAPAGPFRVVRCSAIAEPSGDELGSSRLWGAQRGTLMLEDVSELPLGMQAALLNMLEAREALPPGDAPAHEPELRVCVAACHDLRLHVEEGQLREDLYYRLATPRVLAPPLRDRAEEIPWLLDAEVRRTAGDLPVHVSLVEACLMRHWPGNVRELLSEARGAAQAAIVAKATQVDGSHLNASAGLARASSEPKRVAGRASASQMRAQIASALERCGGNVSAAARELGTHRTQLRRWLERYGMDPRAFAKGSTEPE